DQNTTNSFIALTRTNGHLGQASARVTTVARPPGPGAAIDGVDYYFNPATNNSSNGKPIWITSWPNISWQLADGTFGQNQGFGPTVDPSTTVSYTSHDVRITL